MNRDAFSFILLLCCSRFCMASWTNHELQANSTKNVEDLLNLVESYQQSKENCVTGAQYELNDYVVQQYGAEQFSHQAHLAVNLANQLTEIWRQDSEELQQNETFLFDQVIHLVESDEQVYAASTCYNYREYKTYDQFCPYAYRKAKETVIMVKDLSTEYSYLGKDSEWFYQAQQKAKALIHTKNSTANFQKTLSEVNRESAHRGDISETNVLVNYEDGHWSKPYFDCGGGNIWMMTYTVPFFGYSNGIFKFKGAISVDVNLQRIDIYQCEQSFNTELNIFANTAKCLSNTTKCTPVHHNGFRRGSYKCECKPGFYFPNVVLPSEQRYFNGVYVEEEYTKKLEGLDNAYDSLTCLPCAVECSVCEDGGSCSSEKDSSTINIKRDPVEHFLSLVESYQENRENCKVGTQYNLGDGVVQQYGQKRFSRQAFLAVNRANFLTNIWKLDNDELHQDENYFFNQVINLVEADEDIFAAGNCYERFEFKNYEQFCPYAHRVSDGILVKDLSLEYPYLGEDIEWFHQARQKAKTLLHQNNLTISYRRTRIEKNGKLAHSKTINDTHIQVYYKDGHWSRPYFDCGGGNIWMMTYTVPFFDYSNGTFKFKGTSGIDIDLQKVDIDQCEQPPGGEPNVFANTSKCNSDTTKCTPVQRIGFRRGSYKCECKPGFYFPDTTLLREQRYFNGVYAEEEYHKKIRGLDNDYDSLSCLSCALGCDTCEDGKPCVISLNWIMRTCLLITSCLIMCFIPALALFVWKFRKLKVLKAASPKLLYIILAGAIFLYCPMIVMYFDATIVICTVKMWLRELGFYISYGALLLKTWRISVVFRIRTANRIKITDTDLIKRLSVMIGVCITYLTVRTVWGRPRVVIGIHSSGLKASQCSVDVWDYCQSAAELCFLIWGVRLCIVVRKAPSEFNESRFISTAIYNETLLTIVFNLSLFFLQSPANPDLIYVAHFIHTILTTTVTLAILFFSKATVAYRNAKDPHSKSSIKKKGEAFKYNKKTSPRVNVSSGDSGFSDNAIDERSYLVREDVQDELKKVYTELEHLKREYMRVGNPHIKNGDGRVREERSTQTASLQTVLDKNNNHGNTDTPKHKIIISIDDLSHATAV